MTAWLHEREMKVALGAWMKWRCRIGRDLEIYSSTPVMAVRGLRTFGSKVGVVDICPDEWPVGTYEIIEASGS